MLNSPRQSTAQLSPKALEAVELFHQVYFDAGAWGKNGTWRSTYWMGVQLHKNPFDLWTYQEILFDKKPDILVETGTMFGGSALFFAHLMDVMGKGEVVTVDVTTQHELDHDRITYLNGDSTSPEVVGNIAEMVRGKRAMVVLDSDHKAESVLRELRMYSDFVSSDQYLVVEDTNLSGPSAIGGVSGSDHSKGPLGALTKFMEQDDRFTIDRKREKHLFSFFPCGFLLRK